MVSNASSRKESLIYPLKSVAQPLPSVPNGVFEREFSHRASDIKAKINVVNHGNKRIRTELHAGGCS
jgi:hypothetical protein